MRRSHRLCVECLEDRIAPATYGIAWPDPQQLTLSFVPDGTQVAGSSQSTLFQTLNAQEPTQQWELAILRAFQTWAVNANINIGVVADSGLPLGTAGAPQGDPRFGDIRIATAPLGSDVVAFSEPYNPLAGTWSGDVELNPAYFGKGSPYDIFTVMLHEAGHVFGFPDNTTDPSEVMYESFTTARTGISASDIAMLQQLYGPPPLDGDAGTVTAITPGSASKVDSATGLLVMNGDLSTMQDVDSYSYKATGGGTFTIALHTSGISLLTPKLTVYDSNGNVIASESNQSPLDGDLAPITITASKTSTYTIVVQGAANNVFGMGSYQLEISTAANGGGGSSTGGPSSGNAPVTNLQPKTYRGDSRFAYADQATLASPTEVDLYRFQSSAPVDGLPNVMTVSVWSLTPGGLQPSITLEDSLGNPIPAQVLVNQDGTYTIQLPNAPAHTSYLLAVRAENPSGTHATGNYFLGIGFGTVPIQMDTFVANQVLDAANPQQSGTLHILQSQLFHLVFSASGGAGQMIVSDSQGHVLDVLTANDGETVSANLIFSPGLYTVQFSPASGATVPVTYSFLGQGVSDPIGPQPLDATLAPGPTATTGLAYWWQAGYSAFLGLAATPPSSVAAASPLDGGGSPSIAGNGSANSLAGTANPPLFVQTLANSTGTTPQGSLGTNNATGATATNPIGGWTIPLNGSFTPSIPGAAGAASAGGAAGDSPGLATVPSTAANGPVSIGLSPHFTGTDYPVADSGLAAPLRWVVRVNDGLSRLIRAVVPNRTAETPPPPDILPLSPASDGGRNGDMAMLSSLPPLPPLPPHAIERAKWFALQTVELPHAPAAHDYAQMCAYLLLGLSAYPLVQHFAPRKGREAAVKKEPKG